MLKKLKSVFLVPRLLLVLKSLLFWSVFWLWKNDGFSFWFWIALLLLFWGIGRQLRSRSLWLLFALAVGTVWLLDSTWFLIIAISFFALLAYLTLGVQGLIFIHRREWNAIRYLLLGYAAYALFFIIDSASGFLVKYIFLLLALFILLDEWLEEAGGHFPKRHLVIAGGLTFLLGELVWGVTLLPLGILNAASLMLLLTSGITDLVSHHFRGTISRRLLIRDGLIFTLLFIVILVTTRWGL